MHRPRPVLCEEVKNAASPLGGWASGTNIAVNGAADPEINNHGYKRKYS